MFQVNKDSEDGNSRKLDTVETYLEALESLWGTLAVLHEVGYRVEYDEATGTFLASYRRHPGRPEVVWKLSIQEVASPVDSVTD